MKWIKTKKPLKKKKEFKYKNVEDCDNLKKLCETVWNKEGLIKYKKYFKYKLIFNFKDDYGNKIDFFSTDLNEIHEQATEFFSGYYWGILKSDEKITISNIHEYFSETEYKYKLYIREDLLTS